MTRAQHSAFLNAIEANINDETPKLVYADWLEEQGDISLARAFCWAALQRRHPIKCAYEIGYVWTNSNGSNGRHGLLPLPLFLALPNGYENYDFSSPMNLREYHGRRYYRTMKSAYKALAVGLERLTRIIQNHRP